MSNNFCRVTYMREGPSKAVCTQVFDRAEPIEVRDLSTRATLRIRAAEISPYRHTLLLDGENCRILNVQ